MMWDIKSFLEILKGMAYPFAIGALFFLHAWQSSDYVRISREIARIAQEREEWEKKNEELKISILTQISAEKIDSLYHRTIEESIKTNPSRIHTVLLEKRKAKVESDLAD